MKILVYTPFQPSKKNLRVKYIESIQKILKNSTPVKILWVLAEPNKILIKDSSDYSVHDIHDFNNAVDILKKLKPDLVMNSAEIEPIQYSLALAAKFLKIPLISFLSPAIIFEPFVSKNTHKEFLNRLFSSYVPNDSTNQKKFLHRTIFFIYKFNFLLKTKFAVKLNPHSLIFQTVKDFPSQILLQKIKLNSISNLYIAHHENQKLDVIKKQNIGDRVIVTGHPLLDQIYENQKNFKKKISDNNQLKILILTDSLFEHGLWTSNFRDSFLTKLFNTLVKNDMKFDIKIHPASENFEYYSQLLENLKISTNIFQTEDLWKIVGNYNLIITYGYSTIHTEISFVGMKMILLYPGLSLPKFPLVQEGIDSGHIIECKKIEDLEIIIPDFMKIETSLNNKFILAREKLFYKFDGNSAQRISEAIINLLYKN